MRELLAAIVITLSAIGSTEFAAAQQPVDNQKKEELKKVDPVPPATAPKLGEQAGTTEPSSKVKSTNPDSNAAFVNGVLAAPGAPTDVDTAPAKHFARTGADDQIPIAGYRLKKLGPEQLQQISRELSTQRDAPTTSPTGGNYAVIGAEIPASVALQALTPVPDALAARFAELRGTAFMRSAGKLVIVDCDNNIVVGVLES